MVARFESFEDAILLVRREAREARAHPASKRREVLDVREGAPEIAGEERRHVGDVCIDEARDVGLVGGRDRRIGAIGRRDATREVLHENVLPCGEADERCCSLGGNDVPARANERDRARGGEERAAGNLEEASSIGFRGGHVVVLLLAEEPHVHLFGLTGGIASGKSAVAARFRARGVPVIDADELAREVVAPGSEGLAEVARAFGNDVLNESGELDRKKVAAIVFANPEDRRRLNGILHPRITMLGFARAQELAARGEALACYEAALIVESGAVDAFRPLVVVSAPEEAQIARAVARDAATETDVRARIRAQMPLAQKVAAADYVIENVGTLADLVARADEVLAAICAKLDVDASRYPLVT